PIQSPAFVLRTTVRGLDVDNDSALSTTHWSAIARTTKSNSPDVARTRKMTKRGLDRRTGTRGDPANGGLWKAGGRADGSGVKQTVRLRAAIRKLLPAFLQIDFENP